MESQITIELCSCRDVKSTGQVRVPVILIAQFNDADSF